MDHFVWFILRVLDSLTFGWLSGGDPRHGHLPDPDEVWDEERHRLAIKRIERDALIGRTGTTLTELRPTGIVVLDQRHFEASAQAGYVAADTPIVVVGLTAFALIVRKRIP
jgi:NfeD-like C-terminal, partner-binding